MSDLEAMWAAEKAEDRRQYAIAREVDRGTGKHTRHNTLKSKGGLGIALCGKCWRGWPFHRPRFTMQGSGGQWSAKVGRKELDNENPGPYWLEWYDRSVWPLGVCNVFHRALVHPIIPDAMYSLKAHAEAYGFHLPQEKQTGV